MKKMEILSMIFSFWFGFAATYAFINFIVQSRKLKKLEREFSQELFNASIQSKQFGYIKKALGYEENDNNMFGHEVFEVDAERIFLSLCHPTVNLTKLS